MDDMSTPLTSCFSNSVNKVYYTSYRLGPKLRLSTRIVVWNFPDLGFVVDRVFVHARTPIRDPFGPQKDLLHRTTPGYIRSGTVHPDFSLLRVRPEDFHDRGTGVSVM